MLLELWNENDGDECRYVAIAQRSPQRRTNAELGHPERVLVDMIPLKRLLRNRSSTALQRHNDH